MLRRTFLAIAVTALASVPACAANKDIFDTAIYAGSFTTVVAAVEAAGHFETLKSEGPFTVFAPTDEAFARLPEGTWDDLPKSGSPDRLVELLTHHVVLGGVMSPIRATA